MTPSTIAFHALTSSTDRVLWLACEAVKRIVRVDVAGLGLGGRAVSVGGTRGVKGFRGCCWCSAGNLGGMAAVWSRRVQVNAGSARICCRAVR